MYVVLAWFSDDPQPPGAIAGSLARFDRAVMDVVPETYTRTDLSGADWGIAVLRPAETGYRWPVLAADGAVTAVSFGLPIGLDATGPLDAARRLLDGRDVHAEVIPPFGMLALATTPAAAPPGSSPAPERLAVQQDWLGMCRLFTGRAGSVTAFCSRPGLLAAFLSGAVEPDPDGWTAYAVSGHFGGDLSPMRGVRLLDPGERVTGRRRPGGGWRLETSYRRAVDDVVLAGIEARGDVDAALDRAAEGLTGAAAGIYRLYDGDITLGLSGGKDSRLIAASFLAADRIPDLVTNDDLAAEGETARRLVDILAERGLRPRHRVVPAAAPAAVLGVGLRERVQRLQGLYDYQFPSTYTVRRAETDRLPARARPASITGGVGGLAVGCWYPPDPAADGDSAAGEATALASLANAVPAEAAAGPALARERDRLGRILARGAALGLCGMELVDYLYLVERVRRRYTSAYHVGMVTPFLAPSVVAATFTLSPAQKRAWTLHNGLLRRFLPAWADVPYVTHRSGPSRATRVWGGDGLRVVCDLLDVAGGKLPALVRREAVEAAAVRGVRGRGTGADQRVMQQFAWLAVASETLEPGTLRATAAGTYARLSAAPAPRRATPPAALSAVAVRLRFVRRSRLGRRLWAAARARTTRG
jgi:asparagine synthase (glutamine-hydrolysing)